jgi:hypothetical protein
VTQPVVTDTGAQLPADLSRDPALGEGVGLPVQLLHRFEDRMDPGADREGRPAVRVRTTSGRPSGTGRGGEFSVVRAQREPGCPEIRGTRGSAVFHSFLYRYFAFGG